MELIREHFRAIIYNNFRRGLSRQEYIEKIYLWIPQSLKKASWKNTVVLQKTFIRSSHVTNHGSKRMSPIQNNTPPYGSSKTSQIQRKLFVETSLRSKLSPVSSAKLVMWCLLNFSNVGRWILSDFCSKKNYPLIFLWKSSFRNIGLKIRNNE